MLCALHLTGGYVVLLKFAGARPTTSSVLLPCVAGLDLFAIVYDLGSRSAQVEL